jgi:hypothetical protein
MGLDEFTRLVATFLAADKIAPKRPRWGTAQHRDYAEARMRIGSPERRALSGIVVLQAHRVVWPPKYCFSLIFRGERILALDVNPGRWHRNLLAPNSVNGTHWQCWPEMEAQSDGREQPFGVWCREFLAKANVSTTFGVLSPPRGIQLRLHLDGDNPNGRRY